MTHCSRDTMTSISQMNFSFSFSWITVVFWFQFISNLFLKLKLAINQHWFRQRKGDNPLSKSMMVLFMDTYLRNLSSRSWPYDNVSHSWKWCLNTIRRNMWVWYSTLTKWNSAGSNSDYHYDALVSRESMRSYVAMIYDINAKISFMPRGILQLIAVYYAKANIYKQCVYKNHFEETNILKFDDKNQFLHSIGK